ncbi:MAG: manganese efflux pump MntP family protein [bacterium]|nr:manganese efflux pump MntP family protein [bacterium]
MNIFTIIIIGIALSMDVFAISVTSGAAIKDLKINHVLKIAFFFGLIQSGMFLIGDLLGFSMRDLISGIDHWISFSLLSLIGGKMIYESFQIGDDVKRDPHDTFVLIALAVATSIDAFAVGLSFALLKVPVFLPALIIGVVTFVISSIGVLIGEKIGHFFENKIEIAGGLILIAIGVKILFEHIM